jgi:hypothetical protein
LNNPAILLYEDHPVMNLLKDLPWLIAAMITALVVLGGIGYLSIMQSINGNPHSNHWMTGRWFLIGLTGLAFIAFVALFIVALLNV